MKKFLAALLAVATVLTMGVSAFASEHPFVERMANQVGWEYDEIEREDGGYDVLLSGDLDLGEYAVADLKVLTSDTLGYGNYVDTDVVLPGKTYYVSSSRINDDFVPMLKAAFKNMEVDGIPTDLSHMIDNMDLQELGRVLTDKKLTSFSYKKLEGSKLVKSVGLAEKTFGKNEGHIPGIEVKLNDFQTDDEQKIEIEVTFKVKEDVDLYRYGMFDFNGDYALYLTKGSKITATMVFWTNNRVTTTDGEDAMAGEGGAIWKPTKNEEQEYTWEDENNTLATLTYDSDDGQTKMYYKLSTKWDNDLYAANFADQDAFLYDFIAGPSASSTSRATLSLRVPFVDEDGALTCAEDEICVYSLEDGVLTDITSKFALVEDDNDGYVLQTKLRTLGSYVVAGPIGAADADEAASEVIHTGIFLDAYAK